MGASLLCSWTWTWNSNLILHSRTPRRENLLHRRPRSILLLFQGIGTARRNPRRGKFCVVGVTESSKEPSSKSEKETIPSWARPDSDEAPPWAQDQAKQSSSQQSFEIPFYVYLLASAITAIAAIGSVFEYVNQRPVFGILNSDSIFYAPLLGFFAFTGIPTSAFLWLKSVKAANKEAEEQDRRDGFL